MFGCRQLSRRARDGRWPSGRPTTIKARLSALSNLCDYLASNGVLDWNPFKVVRGPRVSTREGQTPVLEPEMVRALLDSFEADDVVTLRNRAIVSTMLFSFARVGGGGQARWASLRATGGGKGVVAAA